MATQATQDDASSVDQVCSDLYEATGEDVHYAGSNGSITVEMPHKRAVLGDISVISVMAEHSWEPDRDDSFHGEYYPCQDTTLFVFKPAE